MGTEERDFFEQAADAYDDILVPAILDPWAAEVARRLGEPTGTAVDVACGTGVLAPWLVEAGWTHVIGIDPSVPMLQRAAARTPEAEWLVGTAGELPLPDQVAGALAASFGLMFMPDPVEALQEMGRVTHAGSPIVVSTWCGFDANPGIAAIRDAVHDVGGARATEVFEVAFGMDDPDQLADMAERAGLRQVQVSDYEIEAEFWSLGDLAAAYSTSMALGDPASAGALEQELTATMAPFMKGDQVVFTMAGLMLEARA